jgi:hypothetical protein
LVACDFYPCPSCASHLSPQSMQTSFLLIMRQRSTGGRNASVYPVLHKFRNFKSGYFTEALHRITWGRISNVIEVAGTLNVLRTAGTKFTSTQTGEYVHLWMLLASFAARAPPTVLHHNPRLCRGFAERQKWPWSEVFQTIPSFLFS